MPRLLQIPKAVLHNEIKAVVAQVGVPSALVTTAKIEAIINHLSGRGIPIEYCFDNSRCAVDNGLKGS